MMNQFFTNSHSALEFSTLGFGFFAIGTIFLFAIALGLIALKGYSLWTAAKRDEKGWFVALLLVNTLGVLELIYLIFIVGKWKKTKTEETKPNDTVTPPTQTPTTPSAQ